MSSHKVVKKHYVQGYENFREFFQNFNSDDRKVYVYFSGSKLPSGQSWCDDCVRAQPVVESMLSNIEEESHFVFVEVGDRTFWKDPNCPFRKDPKTRLMVLPTLVRWGSPRKLEGEECEKAYLVDMLYTDDE